MSAPARFAAALDALVAQVRGDRTVLAAFLGGSLSHDTVWDRSDIDLVLVTVDDRKALESDSLALYADGVNVHAMLLPRAEFRRIADGATRNSFMHSFLAKGRLLYTHDETIAELCARLRDIGARDTRVQLLRAATGAVGPLYKARKWLLTRGDLEYTALWLLGAAGALAQMEVVGRGLLADREVIPQALVLNPALFGVIYVELLNTPKTAERVTAALEAAERYLAGRAAECFAPVLEHLGEVGEARSCTELENHFRRSMDVSGVGLACEYLADLGLVGKASVPARLTKRSNVEVEELAFFHLGQPPGA
jgi:uncharacterized protein